MFFVSKKKYDLMIQSFAKLQHKYDELVTDHRQLIMEADGLKLKNARLSSQLEQTSAELFLLKKK